MDFIQAVKAMKEGKKVTKYINCYLALDDEGLVRIFNFDKKINHEQNMHPGDYLSNDWEIYEEEDNWNLREQRSSNDQCLGIANFKDIKTLKEKIIEDWQESMVPEYDKLKDILDKRFGF